MTEDKPDRSVTVGVNSGIVSTGDNATNRIVNLGQVRRPELVDVTSHVTNIKLAAGRPLIGREADLLHVGAVLSGDAHALAVVGETGVGKTALARKFALRADVSTAYQLVWWIDASSKAAVDRSLIELASRLEPRLAQAPESALEWIRGWLQTHEAWLIIADAAPGAVMLADLLAVSRRGQVLVTSRQTTGWQASVPVHELGNLDPASAVRLLTVVADGQADEHDADTATLSTRLGCLPATLEHVGRHLATTRTTPEQYLDAMPDFPGIATGGPGAQRMAEAITAYRSLRSILGEVKAAHGDIDAALATRIRDFLAADVIANRVDAESLSEHWGYAEQVLKINGLGADARSALRQEIVRLANRKAAADADRAAASKAAFKEHSRPLAARARPRPSKVISDALTAIAALAVCLALGFVAGTVIAQWHSLHHVGFWNWTAAAISVLIVVSMLITMWEEALFRLGLVAAVPILAVPGTVGWLLAHRASTVTVATLHISGAHIGTTVAEWLVWRF
jgi:hypothetical protein